MACRQTASAGVSRDDDHPDQDNTDDAGPAAPLLLDGIVEERVVGGLTTSQAWNLYTSHFLSTWNVRAYEFAAIIFTAAAYPDTLTAAAVRGIVRTLASICFSSSVGRWVDKSPKRLRTLMVSISANRVTVMAACVAWFFIVQPNTGSHVGRTTFSLEKDTSVLPVRNMLFVLILVLGVGENLSASGNMISMEQDWIPTAANPAGSVHDLTHLNATMRRIDLICKLIAPLFISLIISLNSNKIGVLVVGIMSASSWGLEMLSALYVYKRNPSLQAPRQLPPSRPDASSTGLGSRCERGFKQYVQDFKGFFGTNVWIPSLSLSLLHLSALSYGATFMTFLLSAGFGLDTITIARALGSVVEISSTVVTPIGVRVLGKAAGHGTLGVLATHERSELSTDLLSHGEEEEEGETSLEVKTVTGLERLGLWGLCWQLGNLIPVILVLWTLSPNSPASTPPLAPTILLFTTLSLSRLGLWIFDLTTSQLTTVLVPSTQRSTFSGIELSFNALFELAQNVLVLVFSKLEEFRYVAGVSIGAVLISSAVYAAWVRGQRGHLVHWERWGRCVKLKGGVR